jgi:hypothetical protein
LRQRRAEGSDPFLWAEGLPGVEMPRMMSVQYGNSVMSQPLRTMRPIYRTGVPLLSTCCILYIFFQQI